MDFEIYLLGLSSFLEVVHHSLSQRIHQEGLRLSFLKFSSLRLSLKMKLWLMQAQPSMVYFCAIFLVSLSVNYRSDCFYDLVDLVLI